MSEIIALGELLIDFTQQGDMDGYPLLQAHPGGAPANYLAAAAAYGASTAMIGKVGKDAFGSLLKQTLKNTGTDVSYLYEDDRVFTTLAFVTLDGDGDRSFSFSRKPGADTCLEEKEIPFGLIDGAKILHFGSLSFTDEPSATACKKAVLYAESKSVTVSFDPNYRPALWENETVAVEKIKWGLAHSDIVKLSDEELKLVTGLDEEKGIDLLLKEYGCSLVFVTMGKNGCIAGNRTGKVKVENYNGVTTVDTTGAGDIFGGAAASRIIRENFLLGDMPVGVIRKICEFSCTAASLSTEKHGGISSVPALDRVLKAINERN